MEVFIDESGSFAIKGAQENSWCVVAAFTCTHKSKYRQKLAELKRKEKINKRSEIKLHQVPEDSYVAFLTDLHQVGGILLCIATDSATNKETDVKKHQENQAKLLLDNINEMKYETGKKGVRYLSEQINGISHQLYIQLFCQIYLMHSFVNRAIPYYVQRNPKFLKSFIWRVDQKSPDTKTDFEDAFEKLCPAILQTLSLKKPLIGLKWCDYSYMQDYMYKKGELPEYLLEKHPELNDEAGLNIQKIIRDDIDFVNSVSCEGVQVADLLASGLRKVLRQEFANNERVAHALGKLMIQEVKNKPPLKLITFGQEEIIENVSLKRIINIMTNACRPMLFKI